MFRRLKPGICHLIVNRDMPPWKNEVKVAVSKSVCFICSRKTNWSIVIFWSILRCCTCHCCGDDSYTNSKQMSSTVQVVWSSVLSQSEPLCLILLPLFMPTLHSVTLSATTRKLWVVLLRFKCRVSGSGSPPTLWSWTGCSNQMRLRTISVF